MKQKPLRVLEVAGTTAYIYRSWLPGRLRLVVEYDTGTHVDNHRVCRHELDGLTRRELFAELGEYRNAGR